MTDRLFDKFVPLWKKWVNDRLAIWTHLHISGVLLWEAGQWAAISTVVMLADTEVCQKPNGVNLLWENEVCAFRIAVPVDALEPVLDGIRLGEWADRIVLQIPGRIRLNPVQGKWQEPVGEPRLESALFGRGTTKRDEEWPRYVLDLQGPQVHEWFGENRREELLALERRLQGKGKPNLYNLGVRFGTFIGSGGIGEIWNRQTSIRLVARAFCRINYARWMPSQRELVASVSLGKFVSREKVALVLNDMDILDPVPLPSGGVSPVDVVLSTLPPSEQADVKLLFYEDQLQEVRIGESSFSLSPIETRQPDEEVDRSAAEYAQNEGARALALAPALKSDEAHYLEQVADSNRVSLTSRKASIVATQRTGWRPTPWAFISSVRDGLEECRASVTMACLRAKVFPVGMESWSAIPRPSVDVCRKHVNDCDVVILVLGYRYGSLYSDSGKSYTEVEFEEAQAARKDVLAFEMTTIPPGVSPSGIEPEDLRRLLDFKKRLGDHLRGRAENSDQLEARVLQALNEWRQSKEGVQG